MHYQRWRTRGEMGGADPEVVTMQGRPIEERFWARVDKTETCWLWTAGTNGCGYGRLACDGGRGHVYAHRFAYELLVGPIPEGLHIDHLCRNTLCVNPEHLEPVTNEENIRRGLFHTPLNPRNKRVSA